MENIFVVGHYTMEDENGNWDEYYAPLYADESPELWGKEIENQGGFQIDYIDVDEDTWELYHDWAVLDRTYISLLWSKDRRLVNVPKELIGEILRKIQEILKTLGIDYVDWIHPVFR